MAKTEFEFRKALAELDDPEEENPDEEKQFIELPDSKIELPNL